MKQRGMQWLAGLSFLAVLGSLWMLRPSKQVFAQKAVYHWKSSYHKSSYPSSIDSFLLNQSIQKMYIKMLDVDYSLAAGVFPASKTQFYYYAEKGADSLNYIPVVYITNEVLKHITPANVTDYAEKFLAHALRIQTYTQRWPKEIQLDCDWTKATRHAYFSLIENMRKLAPQFSYSATLRLYPYKYYQELGVPPVNRVMLMLYNLENAKQLKSRNSLFSLHEAQKYLKRNSYPLPMDVALPIFSWTLIFRNGMFLRVLSDNIVSNILAETGDAAPLEKLAENTYLVKESMRSYNDYHLQAGDVLKVESCGQTELVQANSLLRLLPLTEQSTIAIFDLDMKELNKISHEKMEAAFTLPR